MHIKDIGCNGKDFMYVDRDAVEWQAILKAGAPLSR